MGVGFATLVVLLVVAYFVGTSEWALKSLILPKVSQAANADITVESASISPFSSVQLRGLKVATKGPEPLLTAQEVTARYSLMDIVKGNLNVSEVTIGSPIVHLITFPDGTSNLDPITKGDGEKKPETKEQEKKSGEPPRVNLGKFALNNATVRKLDLRADGTRQVTELTGVNITAEDIGNNKTGQLGLAANVRVDQGLNSASNGVLAATVNGRFNLQLDGALKPQVAKGQTRIEVTEGRGAFGQAAGLIATLNADLTPTQLNDVSLRFMQGANPLGALTVSGPFSAERMEGKLNVALSQVDRQLLNLAGSAAGVDFNQTAVSSTNTVELSRRGRIVAVNGVMAVANFSATQKGQTTPKLDVRTTYAMTYDQTNRTAVVQQFAVNGTQNEAEFLRGTLASPMTLNVAGGAGGAPDSTFDLVLTNVNLPDWRAFVPTNISLTSGRVGADLRIVSQQGGQQLSLAGRAALEEFTAVMQSNRFDQFGTRVDMDVTLRGPTVEIRQLNGTLQQSGQAGGAFQVSGNYHLTNQVGEIRARLADVNQHTLKTFLAAALGEKQLESISLNTETVAKLSGPDALSLDARLSVSNLVVNDPSGQVPRTPLALRARADVSQTKGVVDLRTVELALTPTERATNAIVVNGRVDMSQTNAWTGQLRVTSEGLDVTPYYDLFANKPQASAAAKPATPPATPGETGPEKEPDAIQLPFTRFDGEVNIAKFFLREIAISNLLVKAGINQGKVSLNPASLTLNGAPVSLTALANVSVPGFEYQLNASLARVPAEPIANTFVPEKKGQFKGDLNADARIRGAGVTGRNLQKNLAGEILFSLTNANVQVTQYERLQKLLVPIGAALRVPELANSPLDWIAARTVISNGTVTIPAATLESSVFRADLAGTISLNEVMTNSTMNNLPVDLALSRNVAIRSRLAPANLATNAEFSPLPRFVSVGGTLGTPKPQIDSIAVTRILAGTVGNYVGGDAGKILRGLGNLGQGASTNSTGTNAITNAPANSAQQLIQGLGGLLNKPEKTNAAATNAPANRRRPSLNDLLK
jgi:hypothetical protein